MYERLWYDYVSALRREYIHILYTKDLCLISHFLEVVRQYNIWLCVGCICAVK